MSRDADVPGMGVGWDRPAIKDSIIAFIEFMFDSNISSLVLSKWGPGMVSLVCSGTTLGNISGYH